jgi:ubiquinone/menaquinone biosynthesis C-methylase UbiE
MHFLDLGCGTGAVTREVTATGISPASLTGVDLTDGMLRVARKRAQEAGIDGDWIEACFLG